MCAVIPIFTMSEKKYSSNFVEPSAGVLNHALRFPQLEPEAEVWLINCQAFFMYGGM
jgi:hypothetical protein